MRMENFNHRNTDPTSHPYLPPNNSNDIRDPSTNSNRLMNPPNYQSQSVQSSCSGTSYSRNQNTPTIHPQLSASNALGEAADRDRHLTTNSKAQTSATVNYYESQSAPGNKNSQSTANNYSLQCPIENIQSLFTNYLQDTQNDEGMHNLRPKPKQKSQSSRPYTRKSQREIPPNVTITPNMSSNLRYLKGREQYYKTVQPPTPNHSQEISVANNGCVPINGYNGNKLYVSPQSFAMDLTKQSSESSFNTQSNTNGQYRAQRVPRDQGRGTFLNRQITQPANFVPGEMYRRFNPNTNSMDVGRLLVLQQTEPNLYSSMRYPNGQGSHYQNMPHTSMYNGNGLPATNSGEAFTNDVSQKNRNEAYYGSRVMNLIRSSNTSSCNIQHTGDAAVQGVLNNSVSESQGRRRKYTSEEIGICQTMLSLRSCQDNCPYSAIDPHQPDEKNEKLNGSCTFSCQDHIYGCQGLCEMQNDGVILNSFFQGFLRNDFVNVAKANNHESAMPIDLSHIQTIPHHAQTMPHHIYETYSNSNYMCPQPDGTCTCLQPPAAPCEYYEQASYNSFLHQSTSVVTKRPRGRQSKKSQEESPAEPPAKRTRTTFDAHKQKILEEYFQKNPYISKEDRVKLAELLGVNEKQIKIWYQNRRMRERKKLREQQGDVPLLLRRRKRRAVDDSASPPEEQPAEQKQRRQNSVERSERITSSPCQESHRQERQTSSSLGSVEIIESCPSYSSVLTNDTQFTGDSNQHSSKGSQEKINVFDTNASRSMLPHETRPSVSPQTPILISRLTNYVESLQITSDIPHQVSRNHQDVTRFQSSERRHNSHANNPSLPVYGSSTANSNQFMHDSQQKWRPTHGQVTKRLNSGEYMQRTPSSSCQETSEHQYQDVYRREPAYTRPNFSSYNSYLTNGGSVTVNSLPILPPQHELETGESIGNNISSSVYSQEYQPNMPVQISQQSLSVPHSFGSSQVPPFLPYQTANCVQVSQQDQKTTHYESKEQSHCLNHNFFPINGESVAMNDNVELHRSQSLIQKNQATEIATHSPTITQASHQIIPMSTPQTVRNCSSSDKPPFASYPKPPRYRQASHFETEEIGQYTTSYLINDNSLSVNPKPPVQESCSAKNLPVTASLDSVEKFTKNPSANLNEDLSNQPKTQFPESSKFKNVSATRNCFNDQMAHTQKSQNNFDLPNMENSYSQWGEINGASFISPIDEKNEHQAFMNNPITSEIRTALLAANNLNNQIIDVPVLQNSFGLLDLQSSRIPSTRNVESPSTEVGTGTHFSKLDSVSSRCDTEQHVSSLYPVSSEVDAVSPNQFNNPVVNQSVLQNSCEMSDLCKYPNSDAENAKPKGIDINDNSINFTSEMIDLCNKAILNAKCASSLNNAVPGLPENETFGNIFNSKEPITPSSVSSQDDRFSIISNTETQLTTEKKEPCSENATDQLYQRSEITPMATPSREEMSCSEHSYSKSNKDSVTFVSASVMQDLVRNQIPTPSSNASAVYQISSNNSVSEVTHTRASDTLLQNDVTSAPTPIQDERKIKSLLIGKNPESMTSTSDDIFNNTDILADEFDDDLTNSTTFKAEDVQFETGRFLDGIKNLGSNSLLTEKGCFVYGGTVVKKEPDDEYSTEFFSSVASNYPIRQGESAETNSQKNSESDNSYSTTFETNAAFSLVNNASSADVSCAQSGISAGLISYTRKSNPLTENIPYSSTTSATYASPIDSSLTDVPCTRDYAPYVKPTRLEGYNYSFTG